MSLENLDEMCELTEPYDYLPDHLSLDPYHPDNDDYTRAERSLRALSVTCAHKMPPKHVNAVKLHVMGLNYTEIGERLNMTATTASKAVNSKLGQELKSILLHLNRHREGATINHRKGILYRIAIDNEKNRPNTSISAIQEMNKIDGVYAEDKTSSKIEIVINSGLMPRTVLDAE